MGTDSPLAPHKASPLELKKRIEAEREGAPFLVYRDGEGKEQLFTFSDAPAKVTVGRGSDADLALGWDPEVSTLHAELERSGTSWVIVDDGLSRNGTYVNGERLSGRRRLGDGDTLRFGKTVAAYRAPSQAGIDSTVVAGTQITPSQLSDTQRKVLIALCRPFKEGSSYATPATNKQIAEELFLSVDAVKTHLRVLFEKFSVQDLPQNQKRAGLVERAFQSGIVSERDL